MPQAYFFSSGKYHDIQNEHELRALIHDRDKRGTPPILLAYLDDWHSKQLKRQTG